MKNLLLVTLAVTLSFASLAQGNSGKEKGNKHGRSSAKKEKEHGASAGVYERGGGKSSKHQPKKVQAALYSDYPAASNVVWRKYKGEYTATFNNGPWRSTAVYHANGERRDTRTPLRRDQLPGSVWDEIFKRDRIAPVTYIQIERPSVAERIFRVLTKNNTAYYYNENGVRVQYNY